MGNTRYQALLAASMQQLLHITLGYIQMTGAQVKFFFFCVLLLHWYLCVHRCVCEAQNLQAP